MQSADLKDILGVVDSPHDVGQFLHIPDVRHKVDIQVLKRDCQLEKLEQSRKHVHGTTDSSGTSETYRIDMTKPFMARESSYENQYE